MKKLILVLIFVFVAASSGFGAKIGRASCRERV